MCLVVYQETVVLLHGANKRGGLGREVKKQVYNINAYHRPEEYGKYCPQIEE